MATIRAYTTIEQSRKLAEILPLESADMYYHYNEYEERHYPRVFLDYQTADIRQEVLELKRNDPCWSLAALLDVLPFHLIVNNQRYAFSMHKGLNKDGETYMFRYNVFNTDVCLCSTDYDNSPVDACYEMILKLNELKML